MNLRLMTGLFYSTKTLLKIKNLTKGKFVQNLKNRSEHIMNMSFYQMVLFCQFVERKIMGLVPKYYLLPGDASQLSIFFLP